MQIAIERIDWESDQSFRAYDYDFSIPPAAYHTHVEYEIAGVDGASGILLCGADTAEFASDDLFFFAGRLPHRFIRRERTGVDSQTIHSSGSGLSGSPIARVVQFRADGFGEDFFKLPENRSLGRLMKSSEEGLAFRSMGTAGIKDLITARGPRRLSAFLSLLANLSEALDAGSAEVLSPGAGRLQGEGRDAARITKLQDYIEESYAENPSVDAAAEVLALTKTSFCRFVKRTTGRTFSELLSDYRLTVAALHLREPEAPVARVAQDAGFGSLSHFNARFKERYGCTPGEFRREASAVVGPAGG